MNLSKVGARPHFCFAIQIPNQDGSPVVFGLVEGGAGLAPGRVPHLAPRQRLGERVQPPAAAAAVSALGVLADDFLAERVELARVVDADVELAGVVVELGDNAIQSRICHDHEIHENIMKIVTKG